MGVYELDPGNGSWPYHFEAAEEEGLIVVAGEVTLRTPDGESVLRVGDVVCFPAGRQERTPFATARTSRPCSREDDPVSTTSSGRSDDLSDLDAIERDVVGRSRRDRADPIARRPCVLLRVKHDD
jgi:hypothetical protein